MHDVGVRSIPILGTLVSFAFAHKDDQMYPITQKVDGYGRLGNRA
jgi:hypothetical protein